MTTPLIQQYLTIKEQHKNAVLLFQVGDFYEMFFEDAIQISSALNLTLTKKNKDIPMCGFPVSNMNSYILRMIKQGIHVAVCNQISLNNTLADRRVVQIITPGTIMDEHIESSDSRFLIAIHKQSIACTEITTGDFFIWSSQLIIEYILNHIPTEILCYGDMFKTLMNMPLKSSITYYDAIPTAKAHYLLNETTYYQYLHLTDDEIIAAGMIANYLYSTHNGRKLKPMRKINVNEQMIINKKTRDALGITDHLSKYFNRTKTPQGARLFNHIFFNPIKNISEIKNRHTKIENTTTCICEYIGDIERIFNRIIHRNANEFYKLAISLQNALQYICEQNKYNNIQKLITYILQIFDEQNNLTDHFSTEASHILKTIEDYKIQIEHIEPGFKIKSNSIVGYYIELKENILPPQNFIKKQSVLKYNRYTTEKIIALEVEINNQNEIYKSLKHQFLHNIILQLTEHTNDIIDIAYQIAEIDLWSSLHHLFLNEVFVKPEITDDNSFEIEDGRHPLIRYMNVVHNSCNLTQNKLWFVTGPNMGGKSVFLKQNAIFMYLAHIGFYIPATAAKIGIADCIYTRIGADDDIYAGQSTFMFEMLDMANILNNSTEQSFIIIDELGRGTSFDEGRIISEVIINYIDKLNVRCLISSHDTTLNLNKNIPRYTMHASVHDNNIVFSYKLVPGICQYSYGIYTAALAGINAGIIDEIRLRLSQKKQCL